MNNETNNPQLIPLSTLLTSDCYIDCGSNERLREVVEELLRRKMKPIWVSLSTDTQIRMFSMRNKSFATATFPELEHPTHHINNINFDK